MTSTERMLYDDEPAGTPGAPKRSTPPEPKVEDFDAAAFIAGIRPYREATLIHSHGDIVARAPRPGTDRPHGRHRPTLNAAIDEFEALKGVPRRRVWWEVEARSVDWVISARATSARKHGITVPIWRTLTGLDYAERMTILFDQIAGQVVTPSGVTADMLRQLDSVAPARRASWSWRQPSSTTAARRRPTSSAWIFVAALRQPSGAPLLRALKVADRKGVSVARFLSLPVPEWGSTVRDLELAYQAIIDTRCPKCGNPLRRVHRRGHPRPVAADGHDVLRHAGAGRLHQ